MPLKSPVRLPWPLTVGDSLPNFVMPSSCDRNLELGDFAGRPLVLCFLPAHDPPASLQLAAAFRDLYEEFRSLHALVVLVSAAADETPKQFAARLGLPFPVLADTGGEVAQAYHAVQDSSAERGWRFPPTRGTFIADANLRVLRILDPADPAEHARAVLEFVRGHVGREEPRHLRRHAPVLLLPNVFPLDFCQELIRIWHTEGNRDTGFMQQHGEKTVRVLNPKIKIRRDHFLMEGAVKQRINRYLAQRVRPEIFKAFHNDMTWFEDFRIACYEASRGGYFRAHRDNKTDGTAHRCFAMSLNLNSDYEGGYLRFPEYGPDLYRPEPGSAVIFSCSLLHEATDITAGVRFVLLSFFYGEREAQIRERYLRRVRGTDRPASPEQPQGAVSEGS
jgi:peroxiredoxin